MSTRCLVCLIHPKRAGFVNSQCAKCNEPLCEDCSRLNHIIPISNNYDNTLNWNHYHKECFPQEYESQRSGKLGRTI